MSLINLAMLKQFLEFLVVFKKQIIKVIMNLWNNNNKDNNKVKKGFGKKENKCKKNLKEL